MVPVLASALLPLGKGLYAGAIPFDYHIPLTPENAIIGHYSATKAPILTVKSGAIVEIDGGGGGGATRTTNNTDPNQWLRENNINLTIEQSPALQESAKVLKETPRAPGIPGGHLLVGPIYIEGAEPGDSLEVRIMDVTPRIPYGNTGGSPGHGGLMLGSAPDPKPAAPAPLSGAAPSKPAGEGAPAGAPRPFSKVTHLDIARNAGVFDENIVVPLAPFMGVMATCPPDSFGPNPSSTPPGAYGGNLDCKELVTGTTLYLPIFHKGALFYTGDSHAGQGDGEVTGTAIETANTVTLQFILHKGETLKMPRAETPTDYIVFGLDPDLNKAMYQAITESIDFLKEKQHFDMLQAYTLSSIAVNYRVTQVVDKTLGIHAMIPKKIFINDTNHYWYYPR
ncbi:MAG TPA: acetamidase/formamidase family protein [Opitutaceae bacterium]